MPTLTAKRVIKYGFITIAAIAFALYIYAQSITYIKGPQLVITSPTDGFATTEQLLTVTGNAQNISFIQMNGNQIFADSSGNFSEKLLLDPGYNIITVNVTDRFERDLSATVRVTYSAQEKFTQSDFEIGTTSPPLIDKEGSSDSATTTADTTEVTDNEELSDNM